MKVELVPLETRYAGHLFRSRTEARWAAFLDTLGLRWEYESQGFAINGQRYLPDFWLPDLGAWLEIKGTAAGERERELARLLAIGSGAPVYLAVGGLLDNLNMIGGTMHRFDPDREVDSGFRFAECGGRIIVEKAGSDPPSRLIESAYHVAAARRMWEPGIKGVNLIL